MEIARTTSFRGRWSQFVTAALTISCWVLAAGSSLGSGPAHAEPLVVGGNFRLEGNDPHTGPLPRGIVFGVYDTLVSLDSDLNLEPGIAEVRGQPDPRFWLVKLRQGVAFHNGCPLTVDDVRFSLWRAGAIGSGAGWRVDGIVSMKKRDDFTLEIETQSSDPLLTRKLAGVAIVAEPSPLAALVTTSKLFPFDRVEWERVGDRGWMATLDRKTDADPFFETGEIVQALTAAAERLGIREVESRTDEATGKEQIYVATETADPNWSEEIGQKLDHCGQDEFVGSGPYLFRSHEQGAPYLVSKNRDWWGWAAFSANNVDEVSFSRILEPAVRLKALSTGKLSVVTSLSTGDWRQVRDQGSSDIEAMELPATNVLSVAFRAGFDPLPDSGIRALIVAALQECTFHKALEAIGFRPAESILPAAIWGAADGTPDCQRGAIPDLGNGVPQMVEVVFACPNTHADLCQLVESHLKQSLPGFRLRVIENVPYHKLQLEGFSSEKVDLYLAPRVGGLFDAATRLHALGHSRGWANRTGLADSKLDRLLEDALAAPVSDGRSALARNALKQLESFAVYAPIVLDRRPVARRRDVSPDIFRIDGSIDLRRASVGN